MLTYRDRGWGRETEVDIPVELISVIENKRFMGTRLIAALCWLLFSLMAGAVIPTTGQLFSAFVAWMGVAIVPFVVLFIRFFFRQRTVSLVIAPDAGSITFWVLKKAQANIDNLLSEVRARQAYVQERVPYPQSFSVGDVLEHPWRRTVVLALLFALPAFFVQRAWLLLLCSVPIAIHAWRLITSVDQPRLFRKAVRACLGRQWNDARAAVNKLLERFPAYIPAHLLLIGICLRLCRFDEAASILAGIQGELNAEAVQEIQTDIIQRKRIFERKERNIRPPDSENLSQSPAGPGAEDVNT